MKQLMVTIPLDMIAHRRLKDSWNSRGGIQRKVLVVVVVTKVRVKFSTTSENFPSECHRLLVTMCHDKARAV